MHVSSITQCLNKICFFQALIKILGKLQETRYQAKRTLSTVRNDSSFRCTAGTYILTQSQESGSKVGRWWVGRCIRVAWEGPAAESRRGPKKRLQLLLLACCCRCPLPRPFLTRGTCPLLLLLLDIRPLDRTIQMPVNATFPLSFFACIRPLLILSCARTLSNIV